MPDRHLMIDIETLDTEVTSAIVAIGAVAFDPRGYCPNDIESFETTISKQDNVRRGRSVSEATEHWWTLQSDEAQQAVFGGPHNTLYDGLYGFTVWVNKMRPQCTRVWAKSPDFDCKILAHACSELNIIWPFKFWESRCVRTIMELAYPEGDFPHIVMDGPKHDAIADAKLQVQQVRHAYYVLGV